MWGERSPVKGLVSLVRKGRVPTMGLGLLRWGRGIGSLMGSGPLS